MKVTYNDLLRNLEPEHREAFLTNIKIANRYNIKDKTQINQVISNVVISSNVLGSFIDNFLVWDETKEGWGYWKDLKRYYKDIPFKNKKIWI